MPKCVLLVTWSTLFENQLSITRLLIIFWNLRKAHKSNWIKRETQEAFCVFFVSKGECHWREHKYTLTNELNLPRNTTGFKVVAVSQVYTAVCVKNKLIAAKCILLDLVPYFWRLVSPDRLKEICRSTSWFLHRFILNACFRLSKWNPYLSETSYEFV